MSTSELIELLGYGLLLPAAVSLGLAVLLMRLVPAAMANRYAAAVGFSGAFCLGYVLLPEWAELVPSRHWHWLAYLAAAACLIGPIGLAGGISVFERWLLLLLLAIVAAWLVVPVWSTLDPPRSAYIPVFAGYLFFLTTCLQPLSTNFPTVRFPALLGLSALALAMMIALFVSTSYGRLAGIAAGALAGIAFAAWLVRHMPIAGMAAAYAIVVGGAAFVAAIEPQRPLLGLLIVPAAPLALSLSAIRPLKSFTGRTALLVQTVLVAAVLIVAAVTVEIESASNTADAYDGY